MQTKTTADGAIDEVVRWRRQQLTGSGFSLPLATAMALCIAGSGLILIALIWLGPETRGLMFHAGEERA